MGRFTTHYTIRSCQDRLWAIHLEILDRVERSALDAEEALSIAREYDDEIADVQAKLDLLNDNPDHYN